MESESIQGGRAIREAERLQKRNPQEAARSGGVNLQRPGVKCGGEGAEKVERVLGCGVGGRSWTGRPSRAPAHDWISVANTRPFLLI